MKKTPQTGLSGKGSIERGLEFEEKLRKAGKLKVRIPKANVTEENSAVFVDEKTDELSFYGEDGK